jgi:hypothetical protein
MKQIVAVVLLFLVLSFAGLKAQQNHFIYIQTENKQPFYLKLEQKIYSSTSSGYLLVPKLKDGNYKLAIGFPKSEWTEQLMNCTIENNDLGFLLKNFENKGWGLFNLQTMALSMATSEPRPENIEMVNKTDAFSNMLSNVVNDSTIRQTEVVRQEPPKDTIKALAASAENRDSSAGLVAAPGAEKMRDSATGARREELAGVSEGAVQEHANLAGGPSGVTRSLVNKGADGTEMVYVDETNGKRDTIRVFIPAEKEQLVKAEPKAVPPGTATETAEKGKTGEPVNPAGGNQPVENQKPVAVEPEASKAGDGNSAPDPKSAGAAKQEPVKKEENQAYFTYKVTDVPSAGHKQEEKKDAEQKPVEAKQVEQPRGSDSVQKRVQQPVPLSPMINSDCKGFASDDDFLKLRKKMVAEDNDDDMIRISKKAFRTKCFTVEQVKNLSALFLKDAGKYAFFDMAYAFVSDSHNYSLLQSQLSEPYYINRFQAMIRH